MIDYLRLDGTELHDFDDASGGHRDIARVEGLVGLSTPRGESKVKSEQHGRTARRRWLDSKIVTIEGECWGVDMDDAYAQFDEVAAAFYRTLTDPVGKLLEWRRASDDARIDLTNLVANPSFETNIVDGGWTSNVSAGMAASAVTRDAAWSKYGAASLHITATNGVTGTNRAVTYRTPTGVNGIPTVAGESFIVAADVNVIDAPASGFHRLRVTWYDIAGGTISTQEGSLANGGGTQTVGAQRIAMIAVAPVGAAFVSVAVAPFFVAADATGETADAYFDGVFCARGASTAASYFDGDTDDAVWNGTAHASTSTFVGKGRQALVKLVGDIAPPLEGGASTLRYQVQVEQLDPRAYDQHLRSVVGTDLVAGGGGLDFVALPGMVNVARKPSAEGASTTWWSPNVGPPGFLTSGAGAIFNDLGLVPPFGSRAIHVNTTNAAAGQGATQTGLVGPFTAGVTYTAAFYVKGAAGGEPVEAIFGFDGTDASAAVSPVVTNGWQRVTVSWTPTADRASAYLTIRTKTATATTFYVDALLVTDTDLANLPAYFDGDQAGAAWGVIGSGLSRDEYVSYRNLGGLTFPLDFDESAGGVAVVENAGKIETPPLVRVYGPATSPRYVLGSSGDEVKINGEIASGDFLEIDHATRTVKLNGTTKRMNLLDVPASRFFDLPADADDEVRMLALSYSAGAHIEVESRDAYGG